MRYSSGTRLERHTHDWDQLLFASEGVMTVTTADGSWVVPTHRAVWIPAAVDHQVDCSGWVGLRTLYLRPELRPDLPRRCTVVAVDGLLRELILRVVSLGVAAANEPRHHNLIECLLDQIQSMHAVPLELRLPEEPRGRRAAEILRRDGGSGLSLDGLARKVGMSRRSLERCFSAETGLSLGRWRQQARLLLALALLAEKTPISQVALAVGYANSSAFIAAFRSSFGTTPSKFFGENEAEPKMANSQPSP